MFRGQLERLEITQVTYSFEVGGTTDPTLVFWVTSDGSTPGTFTVVTTTADGQTLSQPNMNFGPLLFSADFELKRGTTYQFHEGGLSGTMTIR